MAELVHIYIHSQWMMPEDVYKTIIGLLKMAISVPMTSNTHPILETFLVSMACLRLSLFEVDVSLSGESTCSVLPVRSSCDSVRGMEGEEELDSGTLNRGPVRL